MALRIGKKLSGSYSLMLLITVVLGVIGYVLFSNISETVDELTGHNLPAVKGLVSVERTAFECILAEKNYVLYERDEIHKHAQERLVTLMGHLDTADDVAEKYNDTVLGQDSKEVRKIAREVGELYEQAVQSLKDNKKLAALMDEKGNHVGQEADSYMATKKAEYMEAKHVLSILNSINATALDTRMNEKAYMLYKDKKYFDAIEGNIAELLKAYDKLETMRPDEKERQQITVARKATKEYFEAAKAWVAEYEKNPDSTRLVRLAQTMNETGQMVGKQAADYQRAKAEKTDKIADVVFIVAGIAQEALKTKLNEKSYIITRVQRYWEGLNAHITKLNNLHDNLRKVSLTSEDFQRIDRAEKATGEYLAGAKSWVENDNTLHNKILPAMNKGSNEILAIAQQAGDNGWKGADAMKEATLGVVGSARSVIVVVLIVAILLGGGFAFMVSKTISQEIGYVVNNIKQVAEDAANGKLDSRADVEGTGIDFKAIPAGFNDTLDAVVSPLNVAAEYVDRISKGDIPKKITDEYKGDFNEIKNNLNMLIDSLNEVIKVAQEIAIGNLMVKVEKRSEQDELMKALEEMVGATNEVIKVAQEIAIGNLMVKVEKRSEQDELMKALEQTVESLRGLVGQAQETAEKVSATSQELSSSAQEMNATTEEGPWRPLRRPRLARMPPRGLPKRWSR
jgi:methyl-accepting chemotaxis protein